MRKIQHQKKPKVSVSTSKESGKMTEWKASVSTSKESGKMTEWKAHDSMQKSPYGKLL